jgi:hypothetical protein
VAVLTRDPILGDVQLVAERDWLLDQLGVCPSRRDGHAQQQNSGHYQKRQSKRAESRTDHNSWFDERFKRLTRKSWILGVTLLVQTQPFSWRNPVAVFPGSLAQSSSF